MTLFEVDPSLVKPGWTPLLILVILMVAMALLWFSMRKQFKRIDVTQSQPQLQEQPPKDSPDLPRA
jgi:hypothetical protein